MFLLIFDRLSQSNYVTIFLSKFITIFSHKYKLVNVKTKIYRLLVTKYLVLMKKSHLNKRKILIQKKLQIFRNVLIFYTVREHHST